MTEISEKELSLKLTPLWLKAINAVQASNLDYAITLLQALLKDCPEFLEGRKLLRKCELQLTGGVKKKAGLFDMSGIKFNSQLKKDPLGTLPLIEKDLEKDPLNETLNELLFETCLKLELFETAAFALETIRQTDHAKPLHKLAAFYISRDMPALAMEVYNDIIKKHPTDGSAIKGAKDASARASMQKQKWDENTDVRTLMHNTAEVEELEKASRTGLTTEQLIERRNKTIGKYNENTNNFTIVKELAAIYEQLEDWHNAQTFYSWAHSLSAGDVALATKAFMMNDRALEADLKALETSVAADPDNVELRAALDARRADRLTEQVLECQRRVDQNPTDPQLRYELGTALYNSGDFSGAILHLQQATRSPHIRTRVLLLLGRTFKSKGMPDLAVKQLSDALADLHAMDSLKKQVLYEKGLIHEEMSDKAAALDSFKQIYEVDYSYRDVAKRVESSYS